MANRTPHFCSEAVSTLSYLHLDGLLDREHETQAATSFTAETCPLQIIKCITGIYLREVRLNHTPIIKAITDFDQKGVVNGYPARWFYHQDDHILDFSEAPLDLSQLRSGVQLFIPANTRLVGGFGQNSVPKNQRQWMGPFRYRNGLLDLFEDP
jgi:hypothetical protein